MSKSTLILGSLAVVGTAACASAALNPFAPSVTLAALSLPKVSARVVVLTIPKLALSATRPPVRSGFVPLPTLGSGPAPFSVKLLPPAPPAPHK